MPDGGYQVDTCWLRILAGDCEGTASAICRELDAADKAVSAMRRAAPGWEFLDSLDDMSNRWEKLNKLVRKELERAEEEFRFSASNYDGHENWIERKLHGLGAGWDDVLDYD